MDAVIECVLLDLMIDWHGGSVDGPWAPGYELWVGVMRVVRLG